MRSVHRASAWPLLSSRAKPTVVALTTLTVRDSFGLGVPSRVTFTLETTAADLPPAGAPGGLATGAGGTAVWIATWAVAVAVMTGPGAVVAEATTVLVK